MNGLIDVFVDTLLRHFFQRFVSNKKILFYHARIFLGLYCFTCGIPFLLSVNNDKVICESGERYQSLNGGQERPAPPNADHFCPGSRNRSARIAMLALLEKGPDHYSLSHRLKALAVTSGPRQFQHAVFRFLLDDVASAIYLQLLNFIIEIFLNPMLIISCCQSSKRGKPYSTLHIGSHS